MFTSTTKKDRASSVANTYCFNIDNNWYIIDTSCGKKRRKELKHFLKNKKNYSILCTHYHNDHIANNWFMAKKNTKIIYHKNAVSKIPYLRTNSTGQVLSMYKNLDKKSFLSRIGFFSSRTAEFLSGRPLISRFIMPPLLFLLAYIISFKNTGFIFPSKKNINYLTPDKKVKINLSGITVKGWIIDKKLYAIETPGHTDCHIIFYHRTGKALFSGDALNFLNPNDIQFGNIEDTFKSIDLILNIAEKEGIETLASGHYHPVSGKDDVIKYIKEIKEKHEYVYGIIQSELIKCGIHLNHDEIYQKILKIDDPVIKKLSRISFPVSTLVFLDVFVYKLITEIKKELPDIDTMENNLKCGEPEKRNLVP
jgi:glyoxylase-like metal-dependent hydrolase (beta-lactamase superfamily II)